MALRDGFAGRVFGAAQIFLTVRMLGDRSDVLNASGIKDVDGHSTSSAKKKP